MNSNTQSKKIKIIKKIKPINNIEDMGVDITEFCEIVKIPTHPIWYYKGDEMPSKKHPIGEKNNVKEEDFKEIKEKAINKMKSKPNKTWKRNKNDEFVVDHLLTKTEYASLTPTNTLFIKFVPDLYCVDVDDAEINNMDEFINKTGLNMLSECCWCVGNTKGIHIYVKINNLPSYKNQVDVFKNFNGDLIRTNNVWEKMEKKIMNFKNEVVTFEYEEIKTIFNESMINELEKIPTVVFKKSVLKTNDISMPKNEGPMTKSQIEELIKKDKYMDLLFNVIKNEVDSDGKRIINRVKWMKIAGILLSNGYDMQVFIHYCSTQSNPNNETSLKLWEAFKPKFTKECIYGLQNIAKEVNNSGYKAWLQKHNAYLTLNILDKGENDIAEYISPYLKGVLIFTSGTWYLNDKRDNLWRNLKEPLATIITTIQKKIDESISIIANTIDLIDGDNEENTKLRDGLKKQEKLYEKHYKGVASGGASNQIMKLLKEYLYEKEFLQKLDATPYIIAYQNGILNLKTLEFRAGIYSTDFLTKTLPYDYEKANEYDIKIVKHELLKILNMNPQHLDYYLSFLGYSMTGDASKEQMFLSIRGQKASNGKSVLFNALNDIMPIYTKKLDNTFFDKGIKDRHKTIAELGGIRLAYINELTENKLDREMLKDYADGKSTPYKIMYGTTAEMPITFKIAIVGNQTLNVDTDEGIKRRIRIAQLDSDFSDNAVEDDYNKCIFKKDKKFGELLSTKYKYALMEIIFEYSKKYVDDDYNLCKYPDDWKEETNETMAECNEFQTFFESNFEKTPNLDTPSISNTMFISILEANKWKLTNNQIKDKLKSLRIPFLYNREKRLNGQRGCWYGFTQISMESESVGDDACLY